MAKSLVVDIGKCVDCEACIEICPSIFKRNEAGYIEVAELPEHPEECVQEAMNCCPADCITWDEVD